MPLAFDTKLVCGKFDSIIGFDCLNPNGVGPGDTCEADGYQELSINIDTGGLAARRLIARLAEGAATALPAAR